MINLHRKSNAETGVIRRPIGEVNTELLPFKPGLAYCPPARGHWTIAHTPMLIPGSYMIYLCASACMRGVVLSSLEYDGMDRFSMVILNDKDIYEGNLEQIMIDGVSEIIDKLPQHPPIVMPFTSCIHHFLACDTTYIYEVLRKKYPDIDFVECYMIPTIRKGRITPEEQMQINLYDALEKTDHKDVKSINILGCNYPSDPENDYYRMLTDAGYRMRDLPKMTDYREYKNMAESSVNIYSYPVAAFAAEKLEKRLGQKAVYLPVTYNYQDIRRELSELAEYFGISCPDLDQMQKKADEALEEARELIGDTPIAIDHEVLPQICSLARLLTEHGFSVKEIYTDCITPEDEENLKWLQKHAPYITVCSVGNYACRMEKERTQKEHQQQYLAIGQKAAYFTGSRHFVNILENNGLWGFHGIVCLAEMMKKAFLQESDTESIIQVKAWGCYEAVHGK